MRRRAIAAVVLLFWAASLGALARRQLAARAEPDVRLETERLPPGAAFFTVSIDGHQVGIAAATIDTLPDGVRAVDRLDLSLPAGSRTERVLRGGTVELARDLTLRRFHASFGGSAPTVSVEGRLEGDSAVDLTRRTEGAAGAERRRLRLPRPPVLPATLPLRVAFSGRLRAGQVLTYDVLDPLALERRAVRVTVLAESTLVVPDSAVYEGATRRWLPAHLDTVRVWHLAERDDDGASALWVDDQGLVVRALTREGYVLERTAFEIANNNFRAGTGDTLPAPRLPEGALVAPPHATPRYAVRVDTTGAGDAPWLAELEGGRQRLAGDSLVVTRERPGDAAMQPGYRLPYAGARLRGYVADRRAPTVDPRLAAQARRIVGRETNPEAATRLLLAANSVGTSDSDPSAASRALHFVAMARAVGLPARTAAGVAPTGGRWRYHTWAEVFLGDWVAVDPMHGRMPAEASAIRLASGTLGRPFDLAPRAARLGAPRGAAPSTISRTSR